MKDNGKQRKVSLSFQITQNDMQALKLAWSRSTCQTLAEYARRLLLRKDITMFYRNQSFDDFIEEGIKLRDELHALVDKINVSQDAETKIIELVGQIKQNINKIVDLCMRELQ